MKYSEFVVMDFGAEFHVECRQYNESGLVISDARVFPTIEEANDYGANWCAEKDAE